SGSVEAGASYVDPGDIPPDAIPLQTLAQAVAPLHEVGLEGSPLHEGPLHQVGLTAASGAPTNVLPSPLPPLAGAQLSPVPPPLPTQPVQSVTFGEALEATPHGISSISLSDIDLSASPLHEVGLAAILLGAIPLHEIPLHEVPLHEVGGGAPDALTAWCDALA